MAAAAVAGTREPGGPAARNDRQSANSACGDRHFVAYRRRIMKNTISTEKLHQLRRRNEGFVLIDVLPAEEFATDHIPGARNVPATTPDFAKAVAAKAAGSRTRRVVVYSRGKDCDLSAKACRVLVDANFTNVADYEGGLAAWNESKRARLAARPNAAS
jgi:rhodanese-related sulfurtransferase